MAAVHNLGVTKEKYEKYLRFWRAPCWRKHLPDTLRLRLLFCEPCFYIVDLQGHFFLAPRFQRFQTKQFIGNIFDWIEHILINEWVKSVRYVIQTMLKTKYVIFYFLSFLTCYKRWSKWITSFKQQLTPLLVCYPSPFCLNSEIKLYKFIRMQFLVSNFVNY